MIKNWQLQLRHNLPLALKIKYSENRIIDWYQHWKGNVSVSFSGGKDSTVLLHLVRNIYSHVPGIFVNTGLEYPEILEFVKAVDNIIWLRPKMTFKEVINKYGYPVPSKAQACAISRYRRTKSDVQKYRRLHGWPGGKKGTISKKWQYLIEAPFLISDYCCDVLKKKPLNLYLKNNGLYPFLGMMAIESHRRKNQYLKQGCNAFDNKKPVSWPLAFWSDKDIWEYIKLKNIKYSEIYDKGVERTGCMFCLFGVHMEKEPNRFQKMKKTHPKLYSYCINDLGCGKVLDFIGVNYE